MRSLRSVVGATALILICVGTFAQAPMPGAPLLPHETVPNLGALKLHLLAYHDCTGTDGCYATDLKQQSDAAIAWLNQRTAGAPPGEKLALVLDIDETSLSNWEVEKKDDFGYIAKDWADWEKSEKAPAVPGTLELFNDAWRITSRSSSSRDEEKRIEALQRKISRAPAITTGPDLLFAVRTRLANP